MGGTRKIEMKAHAKVNLALAVGPPMAAGRPNAGYHPICSWMHAVDLHDELTVERLEDGACSAFDIRWADGPAVEWRAESDLVVRACGVLEAFVERRLPVRVVVVKHIPACGGLGGGSSDAGAALLAFNELFGLGLDEPTLQRLALRLGSDIPFFVDAGARGKGQPPRPAIVEGVGDSITRLDRVGQELTLIVPGFGCATGAVYRAYDANPRPLDAERVRTIAGEPLNPGALFNDLGEPACAIEPHLGVLRGRLASVLGCPVHVSGSGSTLFVMGRMDPAVVHGVCRDCRVIGARLV